MKRLIEKTVLPGFVTAWRLARRPTRRSPVLVKATTDGTVRPPSADGMTVGSPPSMTATTELVVPRSMPMILAIGVAAPVLLSEWVRWFRLLLRRRLRRRQRAPAGSPGRGAGSHGEAGRRSRRRAGRCR